MNGGPLWAYNGTFESFWRNGRLRWKRLVRSLPKYQLASFLCGEYPKFHVTFLSLNDCLAMALPGLCQKWDQSSQRS